MESPEPYPPEGAKTQSPEQGREIKISPMHSEQLEPQDAHWLRMDPALTRAVLAKTEEELLASLAALMRNKVEHEQASRRFSQMQIDTGQAKHELEIVREQIRRAEEEVAARLNEQSRINEELDERIKAREALIAETGILHQQMSDLATRKEQQAAQLSELRNGETELRREMEELRNDRQSLLSETEDLRRVVGQHLAEKEKLQTDIELLESRLRELTKQVRGTEGLPLLFGAGAHKTAEEWDSYPLESEFHTDERLDAGKVAELVSLLPGLQGCLIIKNQGSVLASRMPERIYARLQVPNRDYELLFERLEKKVEEYSLKSARLATFDLGEEALTVARAGQTFLLVNHKQAKLQTGMPGKLASIVCEIAKMYP